MVEFTDPGRIIIWNGTMLFFSSLLSTLKREQVFGKELEETYIITL